MRRQNTTPAQMKMFLTRIGFGSKVVITGDATQKDLPSGQTSGLDVAVSVVKNIEDIQHLPADEQGCGPSPACAADRQGVRGV